MSRLHPSRQVFGFGIGLCVLVLAGGHALPGILLDPLESSVSKTPLIVLVEVSTVEGLQSGNWKATARVIEVLKGSTQDIVSYGPGGHGDVLTCDASAARVGEIVVLLLAPDDKRLGGVLRIADSGYGRLPVHRHGSQFVDVGSYRLGPAAPKSKLVVGQETRDVVPLAWLRELVKKAGSEERRE